MPFYQLYYHFVWSTKHRQPLLTLEIEPIIFNLLKKKAIGLGASVYALNGLEDHVHLVTSVPPKLALSTFIGQVKGATSTVFNKGAYMDGAFYWQDDYGVFSFDKKRLSPVIDYVERQKERHAEGKLIKLLEQCGDGDEQMLKESTALYVVENE